MNESADSQPVTGARTAERTRRVLVVDDWITTGSSIDAVRRLVREAGAVYVGASVIVNKAASTTTDELGAHWLVNFADLVPSFPM